MTRCVPADVKTLADKPIRGIKKPAGFLSLNGLERARSHSLLAGVRCAPFDELPHSFGDIMPGPELVVILTVKLDEKDVHLLDLDFHGALDRDTLLFGALERLFVEPLGELGETSEHLGVKSTERHGCLLSRKAPLRN